MSGKDFEQKVRDQLADFSLESVPELWPEINAALHPRKIKRMSPGIIILLITVLIAIILIWHNVENNKSVFVKKDTKKSMSQSSNDKQLKVKHHPSNEISVEQGKNKSNNELLAIKKKSDLKANIYKQKDSIETQTTLKEIDLISGSGKNFNHADSITENFQHPEIGQLISQTNDQSIPEVLMENQVSSDAVKTKDYSELQPVAPVIETKKPGWKFSFIADAGISGFSNNPFSFLENPQADFSLAPQYTNEIPNYYNGIPVVYKIPEYKNGFAFNAGFQARKIIDKHNSIAFELSYDLYQTKMRVGNKIDSILYNQSGSNLGSAYYLNDYKTVYTNQYHFLQLSANYFYQFNTNHKIPMRWKIGLGGAYMIASNGLHYSKSNTVLIKNIRLFNNPQIFMSTGFDFGIGKTNPWYIGPQLRYFLLPSDKKTVFKNEHLSGLSIGVTIPIQKN